MPISLVAAVVAPKSKCTCWACTCDESEPICEVLRLKLALSLLTPMADEPASDSANRLSSFGSEIYASTPSYILAHASKLLANKKRHISVDFKGTINVAATAINVPINTFRPRANPSGPTLSSLAIIMHIVMPVSRPI